VLVVLVVLSFLLTVGARGVATGSVSGAPGLHLPASSAGGAGPVIAGTLPHGNARPMSGSTNTVIATIAIPGGPSNGGGGIFDPTNGYVYLPTTGTNLTVVNGASNLITDQIYLGPYAIPETPTFVSSVNHIYVPQDASNSGPDNVSVINGATNGFVTNVSTGFFSSPAPAVYDPVNHDLYVPDYGQSNVTVINTTTQAVVATIPVGLGPFTPAYDPADGDIYVPNTVSNNLSIISTSTNTVIATLPYGAFPYEPDETSVFGAPVYDPVSQEVYQPNPSNFTISVISGTSFVKNITVGPAPGTPLVDPVNGNLYVPIRFLSDFASSNDTIALVSPSSNTVVTTITVGLGPSTPVYDPANGEVYVSNSGDDNVSAINASTEKVVASIGVGLNAAPGVPTFDTTNDDLYVPDFGTNNVSVIAAGSGSTTSKPGTYPVTFAETGLPSGAWWDVTFNGTGLNVSSSTAVFNSIPNGSYSYSTGPWADKSTCSLPSSSMSGTATVNGAAVTVNLPFICTGGSGGPGGGGGPSSFLGLPGNDGYFLLVGVVVAVVAAVVALLLVSRRRPPRGVVEAPTPPAAPPWPQPTWPPPPPPPPPPPT
jgi:YVTN family beta-propeller protein